MVQGLRCTDAEPVDAVVAQPLQNEIGLKAVMVAHNAHRDHTPQQWIVNHRDWYHLHSLLPRYPDATLPFVRRLSMRRWCLDKTPRHCHSRLQHHRPRRMVLEGTVLEHSLISREDSLLRRSLRCWLSGM